MSSNALQTHPVVRSLDAWRAILKRVGQGPGIYALQVDDSFPLECVCVADVLPKGGMWSVVSWCSVPLRRRRGLDGAEEGRVGWCGCGHHLLLKV